MPKASAYHHCYLRKSHPFDVPLLYTGLLWFEVSGRTRRKWCPGPWFFSAKLVSVVGLDRKKKTVKACKGSNLKFGTLTMLDKFDEFSLTVYLRWSWSLEWVWYWWCVHSCFHIGVSINGGTPHSWMVSKGKTIYKPQLVNHQLTYPLVNVYTLPKK